MRQTVGGFRTRPGARGFSLPPPRIERHGRFLVVRDDLIAGGTKARALLEVLARSDHARVAYACDRYGHGPLALAEATGALGLEAILVFPAMERPSETWLKVRDLPHVKTVMVDVQNQGEAFARAAAIAAAAGAHLFPVGFDFPEFVDALGNVVRSVDADPCEVWSLAGSGCLTRAIQSVWTKAEVHVVSMGFPHVRVGRAIVHVPGERSDEPARSPPPFPSAPFYDAKIWRVAEEAAGDGALIWNVA